MAPWKLETTIKDINPKIETATSAQSTIFNMATKPLIRTSVLKLSLIFNNTFPTPEPHKVYDKIGKEQIP